MATHTKILAIFTLLFLLSAVRSLAPLPQCQVGTYYRTLPLIADEAVILSLDSLFSGFNLDYSLEGADVYSKVVQLGGKMRLQDEQLPEVLMTGLKSHHLQKVGNTWGTSFIALTERGDRTMVHSGVLPSNTSAPVINNPITVENLANTTCFDAVLFPLKNLMIVDCIERRTTKNSKGQMLDNIFYYYRISDGQFQNKVRTEMYVPFLNIKRRKLQIYSDFQSKNTFLIRTYFTEGVEAANVDNTYVDVLMISQPLFPWIVSVIDRAFLGLRKLRIVDTRIYLGQIYILDELQGLFRVSISPAEQLVLDGFYEAKGFSRFAVYSNNLDNRFELALTNSQTVYEIDWTVRDQPRLINKYSLMANSKVSQIFLNERFVFIQSSSVSSNITYNYTWVLNRGDRTYTKAFQVISHNTEKTLIDLNEDESYLIVIDDQHMVNYAFDQANLVIKLPKDEDFLDRLMNFTIVAKSSDPNTKDLEAKCRLILNFTLLEDNNRTMWPIGSAPPALYNANFPGKIRIQLSEYVLAPNVTYRIRETEKGQLSYEKIFQQEQLNLKWIRKPSFDNITFLQTETFNEEEQDTIVVYMQDSNNMTYISYCSPNHKNQNVTCNLTIEQDLEGQIKTWATTTYTSKLASQVRHIVAYTTSKHYNTVNLLDLKRNKAVAELNLGKGFVGNVSNVQVNGKYMYVVLHYIKTIQIYDLQLCLRGSCAPICGIDHMTMYNMSVRYFAPTGVHSSIFHDSVVFIKTADSIIAIDASKECVPKLLTIVRPVQNVLTQFNFAVNSNFLIVTIAPNLILEYDLSRIYLKEIRLTKHFPMYGYKLPRNYDFDLSDYGNCVYISTVNDGGDYNVFVYRSGYPAVGTLYDVIDLFAFQNLLIDASGYGIDYITVLSAGKELRIFRQYEFPMAQIENPSKDYQFYLEYFNTVQSGTLELIEVKIINLPTYITVNPYLQNIMNTKDLLFSGLNRLSQINDSDWYKGNVLYIRPDCFDCGQNNSRIRINNHISYEGTLKVASTLQDYVWTPSGGALQSKDFLFHLMANGSVSQVITYSNTSQRACLKVAVGRGYEVSGCQTDKVIVIFLTSLTGHKPFTFEEYLTKALFMHRLKTAHELVMLVDSQPSPYLKKHRGGVFLYALSTEFQGESALMEVEYLDGDDLSMPQLGDIFVNNAELNYDATTRSYRLYFSEMSRGIFLIEFEYEVGWRDIKVKQITNLGLPRLLEDIKQKLPYDASYQAISLLKTSADASRRYTDVLLFTTGRFHTFEMECSFESGGSLTSKRISKVYLRYAYYTISDIIKQNGELFVLSQSLPLQYDIGNQSKHLLTVYSTRGTASGAPEERGFIGAYPFNSSTHSFDFNLTFDPTDLHREPRVSMALLEEDSGNRIKLLSLHRNLTVFTTTEVDTQIIYIDLINDFGLKKIRILMNGLSPYPEWELITIILFSVLGGLLLLGVLLVAGKKLLAGREEARETLLTSEE